MSLEKEIEAFVVTIESHTDTQTFRALYDSRFNDMLIKYGGVNQYQLKLKVLTQQLRYHGHITQSEVVLQ